MPRTLPIINSFVTGEISPYLLGRTDLAKYQSACERLVNFIPLVQGGIVKRPGLKYISTLPGPGRLIPFTFSTDDSIVLVFVDFLLYFFKDGAPIMDGDVPYSIASPYAYASDFWKIKYVQIADIIYFVHPDYPIKKLQRLADTHWVFIEPNFYSPPTSQVDQDVSGGTVGISSFLNNVLGLGPANASTVAPVFTSNDVGQQLFVENGGVATINSLFGEVDIGAPPYGSFPLYTGVSISISSSFDKTEYSSGAWYIIRDGNPVYPEFPLFISKESANFDATVVFTSPVLINGDMNKQIVAGTGVGLILNVGGEYATDPFTGAQLCSQAQIKILNQFDASNYDPGFWRLRGSPNSFLSCGTFNQVNNYWIGNKEFGEGSRVPVRATNDHPTDSSFQQVDSSGTSYEHITYTGGFNHTFRTIDKGRYISFAGGFGIVISVQDSTTATILVLSSITKSESDAQGNLLLASSFPGSWYFEDPSFTEFNGYPGAICFHQDRLWISGSNVFRKTVWASKISDYENFAKGDLDDSGLEIAILSGRYDTNLWLQPYQGNIIVGTPYGEFLISGTGNSALGGSGPSITSKNISATFQSAYGVAQVQPLIVEKNLLYIQRSKTDLYEMQFNIQTALYSSKNLSILNSTILDSDFPVIEFVYQHAPFGCLWFITGDGQLIGMTYDESENVFAWHKHTTGEYYIDTKFISATSISKDTEDELWVIIKRGNQYFVELFDTSLYVDSAIHIISDSPINSVSGLNRLDAHVITCNADGNAYPITAVLSDVYALDVPAYDVQVGIPFLSDALTVRPEVAGTSQGILKRWNKIWARVYMTLGLQINGQFIPNRNPETHLSVAVPLFTGDESINNLGYDREGRVQIVQFYPLPAHVLAIFGQMLIGEM